MFVALHFQMPRFMKKFFLGSSLLVLLSSLTALAQTQDNAELEKMYKADQDARRAGTIDWPVLLKEDSTRQVRVFELIDAGEVRTGKDYYHSAMIFQHGNDTVASAMAVKQMKKAIELDPTMNKWLLAAAIDRDLMRRNQPQIYGTQFVKMGDHARWERYKIDPTQVTDEERKAYGVETLAEQEAKERNMNLVAVSAYYAESNSVDQTVQFIKAEKKKGNKSTYNISEEEINTLAYSVMSAGQTTEALKLFKLNTELYPKGFNAFDSYGECLMQLGQKKEALSAYKKSVELNPQNGNARQILDANK
jgi:tetratricopeptide (TPR) repeat protein